MIPTSDTGPEESETGFLDVAANALAVIILATIVVLVVSGVPQPRGETTEETDLDLSFPPPLETVITPLGSYHAITDAGLTGLDLDALTLQLANGTGIPRTGQGDLTLRVGRVYRDFDEYSARFTLDLEAISEQAVAIGTPEQRAKVVKALAAGLEKRGVVPTFLVQRGSVADFAPLYWDLRQADAVLRWAILSPSGEIMIRRNVGAFSTRERRWQ